MLSDETDIEEDNSKGEKKMIQIKVDTHTHTLFSGHAFSTIEENARHAAEVKMEGIAMTDHFGPMFCDLHRFDGSMNMSALPKEIHGVRILAGTEIDIVDAKGNLAGHDVILPFGTDKTICDMLLETRDLAIASVHFFKGHKDLTAIEATELYCTVLRNPGIHVLGHIGRSGLPFDIDEVVKTAAAQGKMIEINEHSFDSGETVSGRCREIALACAKYGSSICVGSDAHSAFFIGRFERTLAMLEEIGFPEELVANTSLEKLTAVLQGNP